jgi:hypothetical protein
VLASAPPICRALCRVQTAQAKHLHVLPTAEVLCQDELVCLVYLLLQPAKATRVLRLRRALPWLRAVVADLACPFHAPPVMAIRLTRALLWVLVPCDRLCRVGQVYPLDRAPRPPGLFPDPVPGCPLRALQHELAAEHFLDFQL